MRRRSNPAPFAIPAAGRFDDFGGSAGLDGSFARIGNNEIRKKVFEQAVAMGVPPVTLVDPSAVVAPMSGWGTVAMSASQRDLVRH